MLIQINAVSIDFLFFESIVRIISLCSIVLIYNYLKKLNKSIDKYEHVKGLRVLEYLSYPIIIVITLYDIDSAINLSEKLFIKNVPLNYLFFELLLFLIRTLTILTVVYSYSFRRKILGEFPPKK